MTMSATGPPKRATMPAASGGPMIVATTYPLESTALTRSQRGSGTRIGNSDRSPTWLRIDVRDETIAMTTRIGPGRASTMASTPMTAIATSATT
jgi:hypothetical protein